MSTIAPMKKTKFPFPFPFGFGYSGTIVMAHKKMVRINICTTSRKITISAAKTTSILFDINTYYKEYNYKKRHQKEIIAALKKYAHDSDKSNPEIMIKLNIRDT